MQSDCFQLALEFDFYFRSAVQKLVSLFPTHISSQAQLHSLSCDPSFSSQRGGERMLLSVQTSFFLQLLPPHTSSQPQHGASLMGVQPSRTAPVHVLYGLQFLKGSLLQCSFSMGCSYFIAHLSALARSQKVGCSVGICSTVHCKGIPAPQLSLPWAAGESLVQCLENLFSLILLWPWCLKDYSSH